MERSETFRKYDKAVKAAQETGEYIACMIFTVEPGETFYYGFDGVDLHKGKHTRRRAEFLEDNARTLVIL